ncbi:3-isopropylmalate dehydratase small subunit [Neobacillus sp. D3-1R]|uniref:3-isopropylmalate dehydratase small subunit n=1 Tax=Neobacillus sp. D3-1R TaxID=3445778 RepID=UPI003F9FF269
MEPLKIHKGLVYPLNRSNVDTDQIIPKQFLKRIERQGFGQFLFYNWRFDYHGNPQADFSLNSEKYSGASILIAGENFGCGSSREHAPWALLDYGFKVIIAPSFADIFKNNCLKNGILAIELDSAQVEPLLKRAENESYDLTVNLENQTIEDEHSNLIHFEISPHSKEMLLNGLDDIGLTLLYEKKISKFELSH